MPKKKMMEKKQRSVKKAGVASQKDMGILREVQESERCFWLCNGQVLKSLKELPESLRTMDDDTFRYHVNEEKNDFANWIREILGDEDLANKLPKDKSKMISSVKKRIAFLESIRK